MRVGKLALKGFRSRNALRVARAHHVERMQIYVINIQLRRNARGAEPVKIADSLCIKRLSVPYKGIRGRKPCKIRQPRRGGVG